MASCKELLDKLSAAFLEYQQSCISYESLDYLSEQEEDLNRQEDEIKSKFHELEVKSKKEGFHWIFSDLETYKAHVRKELEQYKENHPNSLLLDFYNEESGRLSKKFSSTLPYWNDERFKKYYFNTPKPYKEAFLTSHGISLRFLGKNKLTDLYFLERNKRAFIEEKIFQEQYLREKGREVFKADVDKDIEANESLCDRYYLLSQVVDVESVLPKLVPQKKDQNQLLATILKCNFHSAKKLLDGTYHGFDKLTPEDKEKLLKLFKLDKDK